MKAKAIKLKFYSSLILSKGKKDYTDIDEMLHSDAIKSALFVCAQQLYGNEINETFFDSFNISSAFPYYKNQFFFPKPYIKLNLNISEINEKLADTIKSKKLKKLQYIEKALFEELICGKEVNISSKNFVNNDKFLWNNVSTTNEYIYSTTDEQHVVIDRVTMNGEPYYVSKMLFAEDAGLFFLVQFNTDKDTEIEKKFYSSLQLLASNGIGSYKSIGNGSFTYTVEDFELKTPEQNNAWMNISLFCPKKEEVNNNLLEQASFQLVERGGYIASAQETIFYSYLKSPVYMFTEGSVFATNFKPNGKLLNLTPSEGPKHPVFREGRAIFIPILTN